MLRSLRILGLPVMGAALVMLVGPAAMAGTSVDFTGEVRVRAEMDGKSFYADHVTQYFTLQRTRVKATATTEQGATVVVELQDSRTWGDEGDTLADGESVDLHQGYLKVDCKLIPHAKLIAGRKSLAYGQQRVIGPVGWHNAGRSFDLGLLRVNRGPHWVDLAYSKVSEDFGSMYYVPVFALDEDDQPFLDAGQFYNPDIKLMYLYGHVEPADLNLAVEPFVIHMETDPGQHALTSYGDYAKYKSGRFGVQQDFVYQIGTREGMDLSGMLLDVSLWADVSPDADGKFGVGGGYSLYTGDDPSTADENEAYFQLFPTSHKFHGLMDMAMDLAGDAGLTDIYGKAWYKLPKGVVAKGAFHIFATEQDVMIVPNGATEAKAFTSIGSEVDLVVARKIDNGLNIQLGGGMFLPSDIAEGGMADTENALWGYLQGTVPF